MPRGPFFGECHGGIPFAKDFCDLVEQFGELLQFGRREILAEPWVKSPPGFNFLSRHARHQADQLNLLPGGFLEIGRMPRRAAGQVGMFPAAMMEPALGGLH